MRLYQNESVVRAGVPPQRVAYPINLVSAISGLTYLDNATASHGPLVVTRGKHWIVVERDIRIGTYPVSDRLYLQFVVDRGYEQDGLWEGGSRGSFLTQDGSTHGPATWPSSRGFPAGEDNRPVAGVCYLEAKAFARWLQRTRPEKGWTWCIPHEDAWELSARSSQGFLYPWGNEFAGDRCNSLESGLQRTSDAGSFLLGNSPSGCTDMAGNVWEFVEGAGNVAPGSCVLRGGSYKNNQYEVMNCFRLVQFPTTHRAPDFGIRCA